jgi:hypothetical protein
VRTLGRKKKKRREEWRYLIDYNIDQGNQNPSWPASGQALKLNMMQHLKGIPDPGSNAPLSFITAMPCTSRGASQGVILQPFGLFFQEARR